MASPSNVFTRVEAVDPAAVTVTIRKLGPALLGEVRGPAARAGEPESLSLGQDGSLGAHQALAVGCHLANQLGRNVVVVDEGRNWTPDWGRLDPS